MRPKILVDTPDTEAFKDHTLFFLINSVSLQAIATNLKMKQFVVHINFNFVVAIVSVGINPNQTCYAERTRN